MSTDKLNKAILESFMKYDKHGARSKKKLIPLHTYLAYVLGAIFGNNYHIKYADGVGKNAQNKEAKVTGKYYNKDIDITVLKDNTPVFCLGIKFVTSNFKQNANNYFENMMGETANIQANHIPYAQIIILRENAPYYDRYGNLKKIEKIQEHHIKKYIKLSLDTTQAHKPCVTCIHIVEISENPLNIKTVPIDNIVSDTNLTIAFTNKMSYDNFIKELEHRKIDIEI